MDGSRDMEHTGTNHGRSGNCAVTYRYERCLTLATYRHRLVLSMSVPHRGQTCYLEYVVLGLKAGRQPFHPDFRIDILRFLSHEPLASINIKYYTLL